MTKILKYLFVTLLLVVAYDTPVMSEVSHQDVSSFVTLSSSIDEYSFNVEMLAADADIYFPRSLSHANTFRLQSSAKRSCHWHRYNFESFKTAKISKVGFGKFHQNESLNLCVAFTKSVYRLISFGKLII